MSLPNYPNNPQVNDTFLVGNKTFQWDGEKWKALSNADNSLRTQLAATDSDVLVGGTEAKDLVSSSGTEGGTGSAGTGSQYVEIEINGTVYKILHDGTV